MRSTQAQGAPDAQAVRMRPELSAEHGVTLVETLISAAILVVVVIAVLASLDASAHTAAINRSRTVAASLAENDLERMRSLPAATLSTFTGEEVERTVGAAKYTVKSEAEWVHDASGTPASPPVTTTNVPLPHNGVIYVKNAACTGVKTPLLERYDDPVGCAVATCVAPTPRASRSAARMTS
jgi:Tfp pilus assembly protein PilE